MTNKPRLKLGLFLMGLILCSGSGSGPNVFSVTVSFFWHDAANWSLGHVPYPNEDVELSLGSDVQLYDSGSTIVKNINITNGCILSVYSKLVAKNMTNSGSLLMFDDIIVDKIVLNNGLIWIMNDANIDATETIILNAKDIILVGPQTKSNINSMILNNGKMVLLQDTKLYANNYIQPKNGLLELHYNSTVTDIATLTSKHILIIGKIFLVCTRKIHPAFMCVPIIKGIYSIRVSSQIVDTCDYMKKYLIVGNILDACF